MSLSITYPKFFIISWNLRLPEATDRGPFYFEQILNSMQKRCDVAHPHHCHIAMYPPPHSIFSKFWIRCKKNATWRIRIIATSSCTPHSIFNKYWIRCQKRCDVAHPHHCTSLSPPPIQIWHKIWIRHKKRCGVAQKNCGVAQKNCGVVHIHVFAHLCKDCTSSAFIHSRDQGAPTLSVFPPEMCICFKWCGPTSSRNPSATSAFLALSQRVQSAQ